MENNTDIENRYWEKRCEFWCAHYLELAQSVKRLIICAERVDDYQELTREAKGVKKLLEKGAYGSSE